MSAHSFNNPVKYVDPSGHCTAAFDGAGREDNLGSDDSACWSIYYDWLDKGYTGLDPSWDYTRADRFLILDLYLQYGLRFASIWEYSWAIDYATDNPLDGQHCFGGQCSVSYQRLTIQGSDTHYYALLMNDAKAWLFRVRSFAASPTGRYEHYATGIGTDEFGLLRDSMADYDTFYHNFWTSTGNAALSFAGFTASGVSMLAPNPVSAAGLVISTWGLGTSIDGMMDAQSQMQSQRADLLRYVEALEVRKYD